MKNVVLRKLPGVHLLRRSSSPRRSAAALALAGIAAFGSGLRAQTFDTLAFGNTTSENGHALAAAFPPPTDITTIYWQNNTPAPSDPSATPPSDVVAGGLGLSARRLLPRTPNGDAYGGQITFTMTVDPTAQNYLTLKLWGSDPGGGDLVLDCNGKEIGNRHGGGGLQEDPLYFQGTGWYANRFFYRTEPLPLTMTHGRGAVTITIRSLGSMFDYAPIFTYVPQYQHLMSGPSLGLYTAYTHAGSIPDVTGEPQGTAPSVPTPRTLENEATALANVKSGVNSSLANDLNAAASSLSQNDAQFLAQCYDAKTKAGATWITYPSGKTDASLGGQITAILDALVTAYAADNTQAAADWGGNYAPMGDAIRLAWPLLSGSMSATVAYGGTLGTVTRQAGWSAALRASVDAGRFKRQTIGNQAMDNGANIYYANRALLLVDPSNALNESEAVRYMKEAWGILPWMGNDQPGGGAVPVKGTAPYGPNWYMCTTKGTSKDGDGFTGSDYGEICTFGYRMGLLAGDAQLQARALQMARARCQFRYPGVDESGYLIMMGTDPIGVRNNDLPSHYVYLGRGFNDDFLMASQGAGIIGNDLLGYFQQGMNDGQMVRNFNKDPYLPGRWAVIKSMAQTNVKLPTTSGQPDYAWADEENMVVAAKHGEERFYANLFWRQPAFINGLVKVFHLTPTTAHLADVTVDDVRFRPTGTTFVTGPAVDTFTAPPDNPVEAYSGLSLPVAWRSDLASVPATNRDAGRGTGYTFRYGNWLVGINADHGATYNMQMPSDFTSATDLITGTTLSGQVTLAPKTSAVFYLPTNVDPNTPPSRCLGFNAIGGNTSVTLGWYAAGAATSYNVLRSTTGGGSYTTVASGVTTLGYTDAAVSNGTTYYYVLQSVNAAGIVSGYSPEASAMPAAPKTAGFAAPWDDADLGSSTGGSASVAGGTFTLKSGPGDLYGTTDGCHFAYQALAGDGVVTARVTGQSSTNSYAKSGLMLRGSLAAGSVQASISVEPAGRAEFDGRTTANGGSSAQSGANGLATPAWVRLVRSGGTVTGYVSSNGTTWTKIGACTFSTGMPYVAYVGLVTSPANGGAGQTNTATFDNVSFPKGATVAPAAPTALTASGGTTVATLNWAATAGASGYNVKRGTSSGGPFTTVATGVSLNGFTDTGVANGTYYYVVSAVNSVGESANSAAVSVAVGGTLPAALTGLSANVSSGKAILSWSASAGATGYRVTRMSGGTNAVVLAASQTATTYTDTGLSDGTEYAYGVAPVNAAGQGQGNQLTVLPPGGLPAGWQSQDVGGPLSGGASFSGGTYTVIGSGSDIWGTSDQFRSVYEAVSGDCEVTARVVSLTNTSVWDKVGVMIRNTLDANSAYYAVYATSGHGVAAQYRASAGGGAGSQGSLGGAAAPYWVRVGRVGSTLTGYASPDGVTWTLLGSTTIPMNTTVSVGLCVCSNNAGAYNTGTFDNVSVNQSLASGGTATANAGSSGQQAAQAFDGNTGTKWYTGVNGVAGWLQYQFGASAAKVVTQYRLTSATDVPQRDPAAWQFQVSNNGTTWTPLDTQTGQTFANRSQTNTYTLSNTTAYQYYRLGITNNAGGSGYGIQLAELSFFAPVQTVSSLPPLAPGSLSAAWSSGQVSLSWPAPLGATGYNVKRATTGGGPYTALATNINATAYADSTVANGTTYYYVVTAVGPAGESANSPEDSARPTAVPATPTGLTATAGNSQIALAWGAVSGATSYRVRRATASGGPYAYIAAASGNAYTDYSAVNNTTYYYVVSAVNIGGESANCTPASGTPTPRLTGTILGTTGSWNNSGNTRDKALDGDLNTFFDAQIGNGAWVGLDLGTTAVVNQVRYCPRPTYAGRMVGGKFQGASTADFSSGVVDLYTVSATPAYSVMTAAAVTNTTGFRYVRYLAPDNSNGNVAEIEFDGTLSPPDAPQSVSATGGNSRVALSWSPVPAATSYNVKRGTSANGPFTTVMRGVADTSAVNGGLVNGTTVYYVVSAVGAAGAGADSAPVGATPQITYADFAQQYGLGNATAVNDNGVTNLATYAFGLPQTGAAVAGLPTAGNDGTHLTITFTRRKAPTDVTYTVETSDDLVVWTSDPASVTEQPAVSLDGTFDQVTVQDNALMSASPARFLRVRLTLARPAPGPAD